MKAPQFDLTQQFEQLKPELMSALETVLASGQYILGSNVAAFEEEIAVFLGVKYAIGVANGTDALLLSLKVLGVGPGDEVIVPSFTFFATAEVVSQLGAQPVFVDIDPLSFNIDAEKVRLVITSKTKAIIPVHLFGLPVNMDELRSIAGSRGIPIVEDACQAIGAEYKGQRIGALGELACFSFFPTKNLGAVGDGGLVTTNNSEFAERLLRLRAHGSYKKYYHSEVGWNSRLDELQAAILRIKLRYLDEWTDKRRKAAARYAAMLQEVAQVFTPKEPLGSKHVHHQYVIRAEKRDELKVFLSQRSVGTSIYYPCPLHLQLVYEHLGYTSGSLPHSEQAAQQTIALPMFPEISEQDQAYVVDNIKLFYKGVSE